MRNMSRLGWRAGLAALLALGIAGCGGGSDKSAAASYTAVVSFGDSLSDPGAYKVGPIADAGGGLFTVNGIAGAVGSDPTPSYTWAQLVAASVVGTPSCAARTGGFGIGITTVPGCTNYAQGGARVTNPIGTGHADGALTEPVVTQIENYLSRTANNKFTGTELVTIQGGANELFAQADILYLGAQAEGSRVFGDTLVGLLAAGASNPATAAQAIGLAMGTEAANPVSNPTSIVTAAVTAAAVQPGNSAVASPAVYGPMVATAETAGKTAGAQYAMTTGAFNATEAMRIAAAELSDSVKSMLNNGAKRIVVTNLPDVSQTPYALGTITVTAGVADNSTQQLILAMTTAFNEKLKTELSGLSGVLFVDVFTENQKQIANKAQFGLTNVKDTACQDRSLVCNSTNLIAGDTSRYLFADGVHPTPYGHKLLAQLINKELVLAGWL
jgi:outer membrane lipase/esterase